MSETTDEKLDEEALRQFVLRSINSHRFLQETPVLPDVWVEFAKCAAGPGKSRPGGEAFADLLIIPHNKSSAAKVAREILRKLSDTERRTCAEIAFLRSEVAAHLAFSEVFRIVLPLTDFWTYVLCREDKNRPNSTVMDSMLAAAKKTIEGKDKDEKLQTLIGEKDRAVLWRFIILSGLMAYLENPAHGSREERIKFFNKTLHDLQAGEATPKSVGALYEPLKGLWDKASPKEIYRPAEELQVQPPARVWSVNQNRPVSAGMDKARRTVKADAVERVFNSNSSGIVWAIVDAGIDARHPALAQRDKAGNIPSKYWEEGGAHQIKPEYSRVKATFDFTNIRRESAKLLMTRLSDDGGDEEANNKSTRKRGANARAMVAGLEKKIWDRETIDWSALLPELKIEHDETYKGPQQSHGTHVAGILGGFWKKDLPEAKGADSGALANGAAKTQKRGARRAGEEVHDAAKNERVGEGNDYANDLIGIAPHISFLDIRILGDEDVSGQEFALIAALQFISYLNQDRSVRTVHGVNISLQLPSSVQNYACGQTPICLECDRLVAEGTVVVAAAGNHGFKSLQTKSSAALETHMPISISDPGNAASVITVGSTHRESPHTYGVSYFSSRGPTGDGRMKPDLLAPGERIFSCVPCRNSIPMAITLDGTSMAAPQVSGAAALLMARNPELIGRPQRIKQILMESATDLGRDQYFQGAGLLDILRALQSV